jgi:hypothetical protein
MSRKKLNNLKKLLIFFEKIDFSPFSITLFQEKNLKKQNHVLDQGWSLKFLSPDFNSVETIRRCSIDADII